LVVPSTTWSSPTALRSLEAALREQAAQLGGPPSATLSGFGEDQVRLLRHALQQAGVAPSRIDIVPALAAADGGRIRLRAAQAQPAPCPNTLVENGPYDIASADLMPAAGCRQAGNLARMLADPGDLVAPPALAPLDAASLLSTGRNEQDDRDSPSGDQDQAGSKPATATPPPGSG
jgi:type IV pilus biogenesis protein CpaD/CtpE